MFHFQDMLIQDENILNNVIKYSSFDYMKTSLNSQLAELATLPKDFVVNHPDIPPGIKTLLEKNSNFFGADRVNFVRKGTTSLNNTLLVITLMFILGLLLIFSCQKTTITVCFSNNQVSVT